MVRRHSIQSNLFFNSSNMIVSTTLDLYADSACEIHNLRIDYTSRYILGRNFGEGIEFDILPLQINLVISNPEVVAYYNTNKGCGHDDWKLNVSKDVSGRFCNPFQMPTRLIPIADILAIEHDSLRFGAFPSLPKLHNGDRPRRLEGMLIFRRY
ncbi:MAG: hypothetical protein HYV97_12965 [Bdellovibrio sp.]|nr:hypothetical protein [Bdellovibrio sp.]